METLERVKGIEPSTRAWEALVLPLNYTRTWWLGTESNRRHEDFQSSALPTELPSRTFQRTDIILTNLVQIINTTLRIS
jgi:hypothetical protein